MGTKLYMKTDDNEWTEIGEAGGGIPKLEELTADRKRNVRRTVMLFILYILLFLNMWGSIFFGYFYPGVFLAAMLIVGGIILLRLYKHYKGEI